MKNELLDVVDENDNVIGRDTRSNIHKNGNWHRGIHVLLFNKNGELLLQKRASDKEKYPNTYDLSVSEHSLAGETYVQAASRGLREELGVTGVKLEKIVYFKFIYNPNDYGISAMYKVRFDGELKIDKHELQSVEFFKLEKLRKIIVEEKEKKKFSYWTLEILKWYFGMPSKIVELKP